MNSCRRCGVTEGLEKHHKKHKKDGGSDANPNRQWLCTACHDFRHAKENVLRAIAIEEERLAILRQRLTIIERENTPEQIIKRGYQPYFPIFSERLPPPNECLRR